MTTEEAIQIADEWLKARYKEFECCVSDIEQRRYDWCIRYTTREFLETRDWKHLLRGGSPLCVENPSGAVHEVTNRKRDVHEYDVVAFEREKFGYKLSS